jgi:acyl-CoA thioesterase-1
MVSKSMAGLSYIERGRASNPLPYWQALLRRIMSLFTLIFALWMSASSIAWAQSEPKTFHLVALGDSLTAGYGLAPRDGFTAQLEAALAAKGHQVRVHNGGVSGDTSAGGLARLDWAVGRDAQAVIIELGANDMLRGLSPKVTENNLRQIIEKLQARGLEVMLAGMLAAPNLGASYGQAFNNLYPRLAKQYGLVFYPFFLEGVAGDPRLNLGDRIHPNRDGIAVIVENILPTVEKLLARIGS